MFKAVKAEIHDEQSKKWKTDRERHFYLYTLETVTGEQRIAWQETEKQTMDSYRDALFLAFLLFLFHAGFMNADSKMQGENVKHMKWTYEFISKAGISQILSITKVKSETFA